MRKQLLAIALTCAATVGTIGRPAYAQAVAEVYNSTPLLPGRAYVIEQRIEAGDLGWDTAFTCSVPAGSYGVVTIAKISRGPLANVAEVADGISTDGHGHILTSRVMASGEAGSFPAVLQEPFDTETKQYKVVLHWKDMNAGRLRVYCDSVNPFEQAAWAAGRAAFFALLSGSDLQTSDNVNRGLNLAWSLMTRDNVMAMGLDAFREEAMIQLNKQFPDSPVLVNFFGAFVDNIAQEQYKHAFYELSPHPFGD